MRNEERGKHDTKEGKNGTYKTEKKKTFRKSWRIWNKDEVDSIFFFSEEFKGKYKINNMMKKADTKKKKEKEDDCQNLIWKRKKMEMEIFKKW